MVIGGTDPNITTAIADISRYDPNTDTWNSLPSMPTARYLPASGAINGKAIVAGGYDGANAVKVVEQFDPATNGWTTLSPMTSERYAALAAVVNGKLYVIGGFDLGSVVQASVFIYDPAANTWTPGANMPTARAGGFSA